MSNPSIKNGYNYLNNGFSNNNNNNNNNGHGNGGGNILSSLMSGVIRNNGAAGGTNGTNQQQQQQQQQQQHQQQHHSNGNNTTTTNNNGSGGNNASSNGVSSNLDLKQQVTETCESFENFNLGGGSGNGSSGARMSIAYINEIVESYALRFFKDCERDLYKRIGKDCGWKDLVKNINYKKLRVRHEKPVYKDQVVPGLNRKPYSLFRSTFVNDTDNDQDYQLRTERRTTAVCEIEISKGYVTEGSADFCLEIPLPGCVAEVGAGFKREYSMDNRTSKNVEEEMTWSVESNIRVPKMHKTIAELVISEDKYQGEFEIKTYFSGSISVKLFKDGSEVLAFDFNDLDDLFTREKGFLKDNNGIFYVTRGQCKASFGVEQKIVLKQLPLSDKK